MTVIARAAGMPATRTLFVLLLAGSFFVSPPYRFSPAS